jgi:hypothetical protein
MALAWGVFFFEMNVLNESYSFNKDGMDEEGAWGILTDVDTQTAEEDWAWLDESFNSIA